MSNTVKQAKLDIAERSLDKLSRYHADIVVGLPCLKANLTAELVTRLLMRIDALTLACIDLKDDVRALMPTPRKRAQSKKVNHA